MAGIYFHIPFCKQACNYCNFHFSTNRKNKTQLIAAMSQEIDFRHEEMKVNTLTSIYLGGGTPSLLSEEEISMLLEKLSKYYTWSENCEITLEANPDDINLPYLKMLKSTGVNRLSIGIQSFHDEDLIFMNRAHNAVEAERCILDAQSAGFDNISADLIYGSSTTTDDMWYSNLEKLTSKGIAHISSYCLTVEPNTALHHQIKTKKIKELDSDKGAHQFEILVEYLTSNGYEHYEISNFALPNRYAIHNTNYWKGLPYLGIGPGAHSYDGNNTRSWNIAHNPKFIKAINEGELPIEREQLSSADAFNEYILTSLRTKWGIDMNIIQSKFSKYETYLMENLASLVNKKTIIVKGESYILSNEAKLLADGIASSLFHIE